MSMLDGVSQCWRLSDTCAVNWEAWAAIGTVAAVFAAVFAPVVQRWLVRKNANALFALAYRSDLLSSQIRLENVRNEFPFDGDDVAWAVEAMLEKEGAARQRLLSLSRGLDLLTKREVDMTKWPAVDLNLAAKVVMAMESARHFQMGAELFAEPPPNRNWVEMTASVAGTLSSALKDVNDATDAVMSAARRLRRKRKFKWLRS
ncbi:hypothetical protein [Stenotrophomonas lactitubi]|uniref:hypothetical protein n=1 Tax=Stenotrophomonas lactitubi TaxID=2045214 RepID=UPI001E4CA01B|nr:hypothetical protein [Stenotrophomonas lactitubi]